MTLTVADFAEHTCQRRTFTLIKRGPKAAQWCSWCREFLRLKSECPVDVQSRAALKQTEAGHG